MGAGMYNGKRSLLADGGIGYERSIGLKFPKCRFFRAAIQQGLSFRLNYTSSHNIDTGSIEDLWLFAGIYSYRNAWMGSIRLARIAGTHTATSATPINTSGTVKRPAGPTSSRQTRNS